MPRNIDRERKEERVRLKKRSLHELLNKEIEKSGTIIDSPLVAVLTCPSGVRCRCQVSRSGAE